MAHKLSRFPTLPRLRAFHTKIVARMLAPDHDIRVYPELQFRHTCQHLTVTPESRP